ncbi:MAG: L-seryl-tRNA(Sec) selenium transferase [Chloroflexi bacterium]|nr:L-seryl-tRNA(Sec) selenium transferase [Chloroflexota bacterium]
MPLSPRDLPSVDSVLRDGRVRSLLASHPRKLVVEAARAAVAEARVAILAGHQNGHIDPAADVEHRLLQAQRPPLRGVINATGVVIHTNLGRAPLSAAALRAVADAASGYSNLEYDLDAGERGSRHALVTDLLRRLTGAEDALVVNNNAAALVLALSALAQGREAVISRGQLIEIGGGFRIPDVMRQSGARLVEVGTTNRTYAADFDAAVSENTALFMRVHASNFAQVGFTHTPALAELVQAAARHHLPVLDDLGSGTLLDTSRYGLAREPMVQESLAAGAALVCFSGDKLLGGPQAGILLGRSELIARLRKHPLTRAIRPDKMTFAALAATLLHYVRGEAEREVPVWRMISASASTLDARARGLAGKVVGATVQETCSTVGGGSLPGQDQPSVAIALSPNSPDALARRLRAGATPVVGRIEQDRLLLDLRSVLPEQDATLAAALTSALAEQR